MNHLANHVDYYPDSDGLSLIYPLFPTPFSLPLSSLSLSSVLALLSFRLF